MVCAAAELPAGERRIVKDPETGVEVGVFNINGEYFALKNVCPHQGAPLCQGTVHATHRPGALFEFRPDLAGRVLRCPWHGWEFDLRTGKSWCEPDRTKVRSFDLKVESGGALVEGELQAETFPVVIEKQYVVLEV